MAIYRNVQLSFWTDNKVVDEFTPEDKYFYLYLFTNPQTNMCGCYEVSLTTMSIQTGYTKDTILRLLERFEKVHNLLVYSSKTKEICLLNWHKYNWQGGNQIPCIKKEISRIKDDRLRNIILDTFDYCFPKEAPYKPLGNPLQATVTDNNIYISNKDNVYNLNSILLNGNNYIKYKEYIDYLRNNIDLLDTLKIFMEYKDSRKPKSSNHYAETSLLSLIKKVSENAMEYGNKNVIDVIELSISNNYQGIIWEKMNNRKTKQNKKESETKDGTGQNKSTGNDNPLAKYDEYTIKKYGLDKL